MTQMTLSPAVAVKLKDNVPLAIFGLALIVIAIAAPGGIQGLLRRIGLIRQPARPRSAIAAGTDPTVAPNATTVIHRARRTGLHSGHRYVQRSGVHASNNSPECPGRANPPVRPGRTPTGSALTGLTRKVGVA